MSWRFFLLAVYAGGIHIVNSQCDLGYTGPANGLCSPCKAGTYLYKETNNTFQNLLATNTPYIVSEAKDWNTVTNSFESMCGNQKCKGNTGALENGDVTTGTLIEHGARIPVPFVGGNITTRMQWGAESIPEAFTICSVTRYSGGARGRILNAHSNPAGSRNWLQGHYAEKAGSSFYDGDVHGNLGFSIPVNTDWVAMCGSNLQDLNSVGIMVNGNINANAAGGTGSCALGINHHDPSDWQLSKVYVWDKHLSSSDFALASFGIYSGLFTDTIALGVCLPCRPNSQSEAGAIECECSPGYTGISGWFCNACPANTFKPQIGNVPCTVCPANSESSSDRQICKCKPGFSGPDGGLCTPCEADKYTKNPGDTCKSCRINSNSPSGSTLCTCNAGFAEAHNDTCTSCAAGKYRPGSFVTNWARSCGVDMQQGCRTAHTSTSVWGGDAHLAVDGNFYPNFFRYGGPYSCTHTRSAPSWWSVTMDNAPIRITGFLIRGRQDEMNHATQGYSIHIGNDTSAEGRYTKNEECVANQDHLLRYSSTQITCTRPITGKIVIFSVPRNKFSLCEVVVWSSDCSSCPRNSKLELASNTKEDCKCEAGFTGPNGGACTMCAAGEYKTDTGSAACSDCPVDSSSVAGSTLQINCTCNTGYYGMHGEICNVCPTNSESVGPSPDITSCKCNVNYYGESGEACTECPAHSESIAGNAVLTGCKCKTGYYGTNGGICNMCPENSNGIESSPDISSCKCIVNYFGESGAQCVPCPANSVSVAGSTVIAACKCQTGYYVPSDSTGSGGIACRLCAAGKYNNLTGSAECSSCLSGYDSFVGSTTEDDCFRCEVGFYSPGAGQECLACPIGTYKNSTGSSECSSCLSGYDSFIGSTSEDDCFQCEVGFYSPGAGLECVACAIGTYKDFVGNAECLACPENSIAPSPGTVTCLACENSFTMGEGREICSCNTGYVDNRSVDRYVDGWVGEHYAYNGAMKSSAYTGYDALTPAFSTKLLTVNYPHRGTFPWRPSRFSSRWRGVIRIVEAGVYTFHLNSDDGSWLWVDEIFTVDNGGNHGMRVRTGKADLAVGDHNVRVHFWEHGGGAGMVVHYTGPGITGWVLLPAYTKTEGCVTCIEENEIGCTQCAVEEVDSCFACPAGSYKDKEDDTHCTLCPSGKYTNVNSSFFGPGATSLDMCVQCQEYAYPFSGKHKGEGGNATCTRCTENSGTQGVTNTICSCDPGYSGPGNGQCVACDIGFYKNTSGSAPCTSCPFSQDSTAASTSEGDCNTCNAGKYISREILQVQYTRSAACAFDINGDFDDMDVMYNGFPMYQHVTRPELFIWFKGGFVLNEYGWGYVLGPHPSIQSMPYAYSSANSEIELRNGTGKWRQQCTSTDQNGQWMILDETVAFVVGSSCAMCSKGKFSNTSNVTGCTACDTTSYSNTPGATACKKCDVASNSIINAERTLCACKPGWTLAQSHSDMQRGDCEQCVPGKFKSTIGDHVCSVCQNIKVHNGMAACVDIVSFSLFLTALSDDQHEALRSSIAKAFGLPLDMVEMTINNASSSRRLLSAQFEIVVSISIPSEDASASAPPPVPDMLNIYKSLAADQFVAAIIPGTTVLIDGSTDGVRLSTMFHTGMLLRHVLNSNIGGSWSPGDKVVVHAVGHRALNDAVLTYMGAEYNNTWSPVNCEPVLTSNGSYVFFLQGAPINLYKQI